MWLLFVSFLKSVCPHDLINRNSYNLKSQCCFSFLLELDNFKTHSFHTRFVLTVSRDSSSAIVYVDCTSTNTFNLSSQSLHSSIRIKGVVRGENDRPAAGREINCGLRQARFYVPDVLLFFHPRFCPSIKKTVPV